MEYRVHLNLFWTASVLALGMVVSIVTSTVVVSRSLDNRLKQQARRAQDITVKGSARTRVKSDTCVWRMTIHGEAKGLKESFALLDEADQKLRTFLDSHGFKPAEIAAAAITTTPHFARDQHNNETREVIDYTLARTFTVSTTNVAAIDTAAGEATQLLKDGVSISSTPPEYYYSRLADLKVQILGEASKDARARADEIVRNSGGSVGAVRDARMSPLQITRPDSTEVSGEGIYDTSTIDKDITAVVTITFGVGP